MSYTVTLPEGHGGKLAGVVLRQVVVRVELLRVLEVILCNKKFSGIKRERMKYREREKVRGRKRERKKGREKKRER